MSFNKCIFVGNLTRDPETRAAGSTTVCNIGIAMNRSWTNKDTGERQEEATFLDCEAWGKQGDVIAQHFHKGKQILLEGSLKEDRWEDKDTGKNRSKHVLRVERFEFVGPKDASTSGGDDIPF